MEKHESIIESAQEKHISTSDIAEFARNSYNYESGTRKAVDEGVITMKELEVYHYINAWTNHNTPFVDGPEEHDRIYNATLQKALLKAVAIYGIDENEARTIYDKVNKISKVAPKS
jgi:hypothetical protein